MFPLEIFALGSGGGRLILTSIIEHIALELECILDIIYKLHSFENAGSERLSAVQDHLLEPEPEAQPTRCHREKAASAHFIWSLATTLSCMLIIPYNCTSKSLHWLQHQI